MHLSKGIYLCGAGFTGTVLKDEVTSTGGKKVIEVGVIMSTA
jgi:hypothetical protein